MGLLNPSWVLQQNPDPELGSPTEPRSGFCWKNPTFGFCCLRS
ncbi:hypothetical protein SLEP1_g57211 [Rubroshorea leprosula]|uniref:Uncharacterized protein n=1 Tax=Rubroshorea leprosula TaxID=152421 RepID=A0AAV5MNU7_9ROSI|nr:hypothetical protein SLEP1_g57211 [Rubroshorea leprosula]